MLREKAFDFDDEAFGFVRAVLVGQKIVTLRDDGLLQGSLVDDAFGYDDDLVLRFARIVFASGTTDRTASLICASHI